MEEGWDRVFKSLALYRKPKIDMIFSIICEELGLFWRMFYSDAFSASDLAFFWSFATQAKDLFGAFDCFRGNGTYDDSGHLKYCGRDQYDPQYWNYVAIH